MANTYELIASQTLASNAASVIFSSIPSTYTDLVVKFSARNTRTGSFFYGAILFNGTTSNISFRDIEYDGSSVSSNTGATLAILAAGNSATANTFGNAEVYIPNYAGSQYKSYSYDAVTENNGTGAGLQLYAGLWSDTSAINSVTITDYYYGGAYFVPNSTFYLYGIKNS